MEKLFRPIDISSLVLFRFFAGFFLGQELINSLFLGDFAEYTVPQMHFSYMFFEWLTPGPAWMMAMIYVCTITAAFMVSAGLFYRLSSIVLFLGYTSLFLMEMSEYINHLYLYCLLSFWMMWMPLNRGMSVDVWRRPELKSSTAPAWNLYLILFHTSVAYFFAGVAKLYPDWINGIVPEIFLRHRGLPLNFTPAITYGGLVFDLLIVPALFWKRTRLIAFVAAIMFHLTNVFVFGLASFPWMMMVLTTLYFSPSWPRRFLNKYLPTHGGSVFQTNKPLGWFLCAYFLVHLLIPLRQHLYPGKTSWTEEGHNFSWRMKTRVKSGQATFLVVNRKTKKTQVELPQRYLTAKQYDDMVGKPDMLLQFAHFLKRKHPDGEIYVSSYVSLNGRTPRQLIKPGTDLGKQKRHLGYYDWIEPNHSDTSDAVFADR